MKICSGSISSGSSSGKEFEKNSNLSRLFLSFDRSVDRILRELMTIQKSWRKILLCRNDFNEGEEERDRPKDLRTIVSLL